MNLLVVTQKVDRNDDLLGFFHLWLNRIAPLVDQLFVIAVSIGDYDLPENVQVFSLGKEQGAGRLLRYVNFYKHALATLPKSDGVFAHMSPQYILALYPLNLIFRKRIVLWYAHAKVSRLARWAASHVHKVLSVSPESFAFETNNLVSIGHGIEINLFKPRTDRDSGAVKNILAVSRISKVKQIEVLVDAVDILVNKMHINNIKVRLAGGPARPEDTAYFEDLQRTSVDRGIASYFQWLGPVPNHATVKLYQDADIFVRMQPGGGFGKSELEAMATGLPAVICAPVYEGVFGRFAKDLVWPANDGAAFAEKISRVLQWSQIEKDEYKDLAITFVRNNHNLGKLAVRIVEQFT